MKKVLLVTIVLTVAFSVFFTTTRSLGSVELKKLPLLEISQSPVKILNLNGMSVNNIEVQPVNNITQIDVSDFYGKNVMSLEKHSIDTADASTLNAFWAKSFGGTERDVFNYIQKTADNGYIAAGITRSFGARGIDVLVVKFDSDCDIEWAKMFIGEEKTDWAYSIQQTRDMGYIISGATFSFGAIADDVLLIKIDSQGNIEWAKKYASVRADASWLCLQTKDDGYILTGDVYRGSTGIVSDILVMKLDNKGSVEWAKAIGSEVERSAASSICETVDGGYIVGGFLGGKGDAAIAIKLDAKGKIEWLKALDGINSDGGCSIQQTKDKGYIMSGWTMSYGAGNNDVLVVKLDEKGNVAWSKSYGASKDDWSNFVQETEGDGFVVGGGTTSFSSGDQDMLILKIDKNGKVEWARVFGGKLNERVWSVTQTSEKGYVAAGESNSFGTGNSDAILIHLDETGNIPGTSCEYLKDVTSEIKVTEISSDFVTPAIVETNIKYEVQPVSLIPQSLTEKTVNICISLTYKINTSASSNGRILPSGPVEVYSGSSQTFTIEPNQGHKIKDVKIDGTSVGAASSYTFTNVTQDHTIEATFEKEKKTTVIILKIGSAIMTVNGNPIKLDASPEIKDGRAFLPIRAISEAFGAYVEWIASTKGITVSLGSKEIGLQIGNPTAVINNEVIVGIVAPYIKNNRTMVPLRVIAEGLGAAVEWDPQTKTITITM